MKVFIDHIVYGPTPEESRVVLSNGDELGGIEFATPHEISPNVFCRVSLIVRLGPDGYKIKKRPN